MKLLRIVLLAIVTPSTWAADELDLLNYTVSEKSVPQKVVMAWRVLADTTEFTPLPDRSYHSLFLQGSKFSGPSTKVPDLLPLPPGYQWQVLFSESLWCLRNLHKAEIEAYSLHSNGRQIPWLSLWRVKKIYPGEILKVFFWTERGFTDPATLETFLFGRPMIEVPPKEVTQGAPPLAYEVADAFTKNSEYAPQLDTNSPDFLIQGRTYRLSDSERFLDISLPVGLRFGRKPTITIEVNGIPLSLVEFNFRRKGPLLGTDPRVQIWLVESPNSNHRFLWTRRGFSSRRNVNQFLNLRNETLPTPPPKIRNTTFDYKPLKPVPVPDEENPFDFLDRALEGNRFYGLGGITP